MLNAESGMSTADQTLSRIVLSRLSRPRRFLDVGKFRSLEFDLVGCLLACAHWSDPVVSLYSFDDFSQHQRFDLVMECAMTPVSIAAAKWSKTNQSQLLVSALNHNRIQLYDLEGDVVVLDLNAGSCLYGSVHGRAGIADFQMSCDGHLIAGGTRTSSVLLWDLRQRNEALSLDAMKRIDDKQTSGDMNSVSFSGDSQLLFSICANGSMQCFDVRYSPVHVMRSSIRPEAMHSSIEMFESILTDDGLVSLWCDGTVTCFDLCQQRSVTLLNGSAQASLVRSRTLSMHSRFNLLSFAQHDKMLVFQPMNSHVPSSLTTLDSMISCSTFHVTDPFLVCASKDGSLNCFEAGRIVE
jgi:WD40 repeat protein